MASPNRYAIRDAGIATFYSLTTGKPIVTLNTLKTSGVDTSGETTYARGGAGNAKLIGFSSNREAKITLVDAIFDNAAIGMLTGNTVTAGVKNIDYNEVKTVATNAITLTKTPVGALKGVYVVNADGTNGTEVVLKEDALSTGEYEISGKNITFFTGDHADGVKIRVYYVVATDSTAKTTQVTSDKFGQSFRVVIDVMVRDEYTKADYAAQIRVPNAKFEDNFNFSFAADGEPAVLDLPLECLKDSTSTLMWEMVVFDASAIS